MAILRSVIGGEDLLGLIQDSSVIITADSLIDIIFTGLEGTIYKGSSKLNSLIFLQRAWILGKFK